MSLEVFSTNKNTAKFAVYDDTIMSVKNFGRHDIMSVIIKRKETER